MASELLVESDEVASLKAAIRIVEPRFEVSHDLRSRLRENKIEPSGFGDAFRGAKEEDLVSHDSAAERNAVVPPEQKRSVGLGLVDRVGAVKRVVAVKKRSDSVIVVRSGLCDHVDDGSGGLSKLGLVA